MVMNLYWVALIILGMKVLGSIGIGLSEEKDDKAISGLGAVIVLALLITSVAFTSPLMINSILNYLGVDKVYAWHETLPISLIMAIYSASPKTTSDIRQIKEKLGI